MAALKILPSPLCSVGTVSTYTLTWCVTNWPNAATEIRLWPISQLVSLAVLHSRWSDDERGIRQNLPSNRRWRPTKMPDTAQCPVHDRCPWTHRQDWCRCDNIRFCRRPCPGRRRKCRRYANMDRTCTITNGVQVNCVTIKIRLKIVKFFRHKNLLPCMHMPNPLLTTV